MSKLAPALQNTLSHEQDPAVPEPGLHKDELDSILGDVSETHLDERQHTCKPIAKRKMAAMLSTQMATQWGCLCLDYMTGNRNEKRNMHKNLISELIFVFFKAALL